MGSILIKSLSEKAYGWMSFASWYSIHYNLPDSQVLLEKRFVDVFWPERCKVSYGKEADLVIEPFVMAVRPYEDLKIVPAKSDNQTTFASYEEGCGDFVLSSWIHKVKTPFRKAIKRFSNERLTVNEMAILKLWEQMSLLYSAL